MNPRGWIWAFCGCCVIAWAILRTHQPADTGPPGQWVVRTYDVGDLLGPPDAAPPPPVIVVPPRDIAPPPTDVGFGAGGHGPTRPPPTTGEDLMTMIRRSIDPASWRKGGGHVVQFDRRLIVTQTRANHDLTRELLADLRVAFGRPLYVTVTWASLRDDQLASITRPATPSSPSAARPVDTTALDRIPGAVLQRAQGATHSGRWIELQTGRARTAVVDADANVDFRAASYTPRSRQLLDGASVRLLPTLLPDGQSVLVDLRAELTRFGGTPDAPPIELPPALGSGSPTPLKLDRLNFAVQSISTAVRIPAGVDAIIGGARDGDDATRADGRSLYLIVRLTPSPQPPHLVENR